MTDKEAVPGEFKAPKSTTNVRIWLTLLEDAGKVEWPPKIENQGWKVLLTRSATVLGCSHPGLYRTSPVFPATDKFIEPDISTGTHYISFYSFDPAFPVLGRLVGNASQGLKAGLMYTMGLASILVITDNLPILDELEQIANEAPRSKEVWELQDGNIISVQCYIAERKAATLQPSTPSIRSYEALPLAVRTTLDEFIASIAVTLPKVQIHIPDELHTFLALTSLVDNLAGEMLYAFDPRGNLPETLSEYSEQQFSEDPSLSVQIIHQNMDRLVRIDSALSYVATQALTGAVPILDRRSLIRRYSLLGVGTAVLALTRIAHSIETAFAEGAIETILEDWGSDLTPLPGLDELPQYDPSNWRDSSRHALNKKVAARGLCPKLPYFSGRLGFRETEYTVSASIQSLGAGASAEWSFLTVTHEMVHGHVRHLLSVILQGDPKEQTDEKWKRFYDRYASRCLDRIPPPDEGLLDSLRAIILTYCCNTIGAGSLTKTPQLESSSGRRIKFYSDLPKPEVLRTVLSAEFRNIGEILVHILDMHYFYCSCLSKYIRLIWKSWSKAPQVRADLRQYLLRSLLVIAAKKQGGPGERFSSCRAFLQDILDGLSKELDSAKFSVGIRSACWPGGGWIVRWPDRSNGPSASS